MSIFVQSKFLTLKIVEIKQKWRKKSIIWYLFLLETAKMWTKYMDTLFSKKRRKFAFSLSFAMQAVFLAFNENDPIKGSLMTK